MKPKEYPVGNELAKLHEEYKALRDLRNCYVKLPFGYKRARKAAIEAQLKLQDFWLGFSVLYPEIPKGQTLAYYPEKESVTFCEGEIK